MRRFARVIVIFLLVALTIALSHSRSIPEAVNPIRVASAGSNVWTSLGPEGGRITALAVDPSHTSVLYAGTFDGHGLFKTTDGGANWSAVNTGLAIPEAVEAITVDSQGTVYAGANGAIVKGSAQGSNWSLAQGVTQLISSIAVASPTVIYAATRGGGVLKSSDAGASFQQANTGLTAMDLLAFAIDSSGNLYAGATSGGVFKADSAAANWVPMNTGLPQSVILGLLADSSGAVYASSLGGVYKTTDGAAHWNAANSGLGLGAPSIAMDSAGTIYAETTLSPLFKTSNAAGTWSKVNSGLASNVSLNCLAVDPSGATLYAGTEQGFFRTTSGLFSWISDNSGFNATEVFALTFDPTSPGTLYASVFGSGVYKSTDNGSTWSLLSEPFIYIRPLAVDSAGRAFTGAQGALSRTTDHGATWSTITPAGSTSAIIWNLDVSSATYYGATSAGLITSTDAGATWNSSATGLGGAGLYSVAVDPSNVMIVYAGSNGHGLYKSSDGGATFSPSSSGFSGTAPLALTVDPSGVVYAGAENGLFKSTDHGATWNPLTNGLNGNLYSVVVDPASPATVYAAGSSGVFRSTDGGSTFAQLSSAGYPSGFLTWTLALDPANHASVFTGTIGGGAFQGQFVGGPTLTLAVFTPPKKLVISGAGFSDAPSLKINGVDASGFIRSSSDISISLKGKAKNLKLVSGANSLQVFDKNGVGSNVFTLNF